MEFQDAAASPVTKMKITDPVSTVMTRSVVIADKFQNFSDMLKLFSQYDMHHLPIVDGNGAIIGIVSSNDLMKVFTDPKFRNISLNSDEADKLINIPDIMTTEVFTVTSTDTLKHAAKILSDNKILALPVVDNGQIVGIVSGRDLVQLVAYFS
jgi:CBS domain-containing protein